MVELSASSLQEFARLFAVEVSSLRLVNAGINRVWRGQRGEAAVYLRCGHEEHFGQDKMRGATEYLAHAFLNGAPVCEPLRSVDGAWFKPVLTDNGQWYATLVREAPGKRLDPLQLSPLQAQAWGRAIGALHLATRDFKPAPGSLIKRFGNMWQGEIEQALARFEPCLLPLYHDLSAWKASLRPRQATSGVVHGDMRAGNAFWNGEQVTIIDFDEPNWDLLAADLARPLLECGAKRRTDLFPFLLAGYRAGYRTHDRLEELLPRLVQQRALTILGWSTGDIEDRSAGPSGDVVGVDSSDAHAFYGWLRAWLLTDQEARQPDSANAKAPPSQGDR